MDTTISAADIAIATVLREARRSIPLTQAVLADRIGIAQNTLCNWEAGQRSPSISQLPAIARALGLTPLTLAKRIFKNIPNCD